MTTARSHPSCAVSTMVNKYTPWRNQSLSSKGTRRTNSLRFIVLVTVIILLLNAFLHVRRFDLLPSLMAGVGSDSKNDLTSSSSSSSFSSLKEKQEQEQGKATEKAYGSSEKDGAKFTVDDPYLKSKQPTPRNVEERLEDVAFVHIGKAGGSSILREAWPNSKKLCQKRKQQRNQTDANSNNTWILMNETDTVQGTDKNKYLAEPRMPEVVHPCIISRIETHVHMWASQRVYHEYRHFIVPIRNPVDRLISWYNYEAQLQERNPEKCQNKFLEVLRKECYSSVGEMLSYGLFDYDKVANASSYKARYFPGPLVAVKAGLPPFKYDDEDDDENDQNNNDDLAFHDENGNNRTMINIKKNKTVIVIKNPKAVELPCRRIATECVLGHMPCFAHNFYNNEVYLEDLLLWKETCTRIPTDEVFLFQNDTPTTTATHITDDDDDDDDGENLTIQKRLQQMTKKLHKFGTPHDTLDCKERGSIRIDVIRTEHVELDFNRTLELWTGMPLRSLQDIGYAINNAIPTKHDNDNKTTATTKHKDMKFVPQRIITKLCQQICTELIIYKRALYYADNLYGQDVIDSWNELDVRCNMDVDKVCGTDFVYRSIKIKKQIGTQTSKQK